MQQIDIRFIVFTIIVFGFTDYSVYCETDTNVSVPEFTEVESDFLKRFDDLFNKDIVGQNDQYKNNIKHLILIHARDLLKKNGETKIDHFDNVLVKRHIRYDPSIYLYSYGETNYRNTPSFPTEKEEQKQVMYAWSIGIKNHSATLSNPCYLDFLGIYNGAIVLVHLDITHQACGGTFSLCCFGTTTPQYIDDPIIRKEVLNRIDVIPTLEQVVFPIKNDTTYRLRLKSNADTHIFSFVSYQNTDIFLKSTDRFSESIKNRWVNEKDKKE
ncbi:MAG: hypothetical protein LBC02_07285 [Planctomycetaceae bacterium]|jgi:hypothetical protein|nr:hypothetical protein [Planctomycetaceae bacterium]